MKASSSKQPPPIGTGLGSLRSDALIGSPRGQGTVQWMAPEVVNGQVQPQDWHLADVWSLGCSVIEMATGRPLWNDDS